MNECETIKSCFLSCHIRYKERFTQNGYNRYSCLRTSTHWKIHIRLYCKSIHLWCIKPFFNRDTFKSFVCWTFPWTSLSSQIFIWNAATNLILFQRTYSAVYIVLQSVNYHLCFRCWLCGSIQRTAHSESSFSHGDSRLSKKQEHD